MASQPKKMSFEDRARFLRLPFESFLYVIIWDESGTQVCNENILYGSQYTERWFLFISYSNRENT